MPLRGSEFYKFASSNVGLLDQIHREYEAAAHPVVPHSCDYCQRVLVQWTSNGPDENADEEGTETGVTIGEMLEGAGQGCVLGLHLAHALKMADSDSPADDSLEAVYPRRSAADERISLPHELPPTYAPISDIHYQSMRALLEKCLETHEECAAFSRRFTPDRVIRVSGSPEHPKLCLSCGPQEAPYAALSYRWGARQPMMTTKQRLDDYASDIPFHNLSRSVQDAVVVTLRLGIEYLWVDAICIVQDDDGDRSKQVAQMHNIYLGSVITIFADSAETCEDGFLEPTSYWHNQSFRLRAGLDGSEVAEIVVANTLPMPRCSSAERSLDKRGWAFQERWLTARRLRYERNSSSYSCICWTYRDGPYYRYCSTARRLDHLGDAFLVAPHPDLWAGLVAEYSTCWLTYTRDKLPAFAGMASVYREAMPVTDYYAGIWRENFLQQLTWRAYGDATRPDKYRAPSWSWAALDGFVRVDNPWAVTAMAVELLSVVTVPLDPVNLCGEVTGGHVIIRARMRPVTIFGLRVNIYPMFLTETIELPIVPAWAEEEAEISNIVEVDDRLRCFIDVMSEVEDRRMHDFWVLEVCWMTDPHWSSALVLDELEDGSGRFRRVGIMHISVHPPQRFFFDEDNSEIRDVTIV